MKSYWMMSIILIAVPTLSMAQTIRCGTRLISIGSSQAEVVAVCGNPTQVNHGSVTRGAVGVATRPTVVVGTSEEVESEVWIFNFGPNSLMQRVRFEDGIVVSIDSLGYGF
jgi:hypothetical protein